MTKVGRTVRRYLAGHSMISLTCCTSNKIRLGVGMVRRVTGLDVALLNYTLPVKPTGPVWE